MIDSGVDLSHEEFAGRPNTIALNTQSTTANDEELHGTATASVVGAPVNAKGIVGIYPQAKLQLWDASPTGQLTVGDEIAGLAAARRRGQGVINLSLGGFDRLPIEEHAILNAFGAGLLVVASAGNDREEGSSLSYPASFAHVLTVGATDESDRVTVFSSASPAMDLAAPGQDITAAIPTLFDPSGYASVDGTSFSAPLVSGAAAAVWTLRPTLTNTQLFEVMRRSARDVGKAGWDADTGFGILDVPAALTRKPPPRRPAGAERGRLSRPAERPDARRQDSAHRAAPAARDDLGLARAARGPGGRLPRLPAGQGQDRRHGAAERERQPRALGKADEDRLRARRGGAARPARRLGARRREVRAHHPEGPRRGPVRLRGRVPAEERRAGVLQAQRRSRRTLAAA